MTKLKVARLSSRVRAAALAVLVCYTAPAASGELGAFNDAVAGAYAHYRGALFYARTGNLGVSAVELAQMAGKWQAILDRFAATPPDPFADDPEWEATLRRVAGRIAAAEAAAGRGEAAATEHALTPIRQELAALRQRNNVVVFSDCVDELQAAVDALWPDRRQAPDLASAERLDRFKARLGVVGYLVRRCRPRAPAAARADATFNRLFDGAEDRLSRLWRVLEKRDSAPIVGLLRELRSIEGLLFLHFG